MSLVSEYKRQFQWRAWPQIFAALPAVSGRKILDLGCGIGDQAAELVARGTRVTGIDASEEFIAEARRRNLPGAEFRTGDLRALGDVGRDFDGIWCSFAAAYFPEFHPVLVSWLRHLHPGAWIALTEIDDLFGHEPLSPATRSLLAHYATEAFVSGRYDFHMGSKLERHVRSTGLKPIATFTVPDRELAFDGPAGDEVIDAWELRFARMSLLRDFCGAAFADVRDEFLACLRSDKHRSRSQVFCCIAASSLLHIP